LLDKDDGSRNEARKWLTLDRLFSEGVMELVGYFLEDFCWDFLLGLGVDDEDLNVPVS
jgi:hypothetical protein